MSAFVLALALFLQQQPTAAIIEGQVLRLGTAQPVGESRILLTKVGGRLTDSIVATSDSMGHFSIANIPPGSYRVFADHDDYIRAEYGQRSPARPGAPLTLAAGQRVSSLAITITPSATIAGRVTNQDGVPVAKVFVRSFKAAYVQGERTLSLVQATLSNDLGEYRMFGLAPGIYFISVTPYAAPMIRDGSYVVPTPPRLDSFGEGFSSQSLAGLLRTGARVDPLALTGESNAQVYYPGTTDVRSARAIDVQPGAVVRGIDVNTMLLPRTTGFRVTGQIVDGKSGQSVSGTRWTVSQPGLLPTVREGNAPTGNFEIADLPPGRYNIQGFVAPTGIAGPAMTGSASIEVSTSNLDNIRIPMSPPITLSGRASGMTPALSTAIIAVQPRSGGLVPISADGSFSIPNVRPGDYALTLTGAPPNFYIASAKLGESDVTSTLHLETTPTQPLAIVISPNAGVVDGKVLDSRQRPIAAATVVLIPAPSLRKRFDLYRSASSSTDGRFLLEGIIPGEYKVFAWENIEENAWQDSDVLRLYENQGKPIQIRDASRENLEIAIP